MMVKNILLHTYAFAFKVCYNRKTINGENPMKYLKYVIAATAIFSLPLAQAKENTPQQYRVTFNIENAGQSIGGWSKVVTATELQKGVDAPIVNVVDPKIVRTATQQYALGFNIKMNVLRMNLPQKGYGNYLTIMAAYTSTQQIMLSNEKIDKDESTLAQGKIVKSVFTVRQQGDIKEVNTINFAKLYDVTTPRNIEVPFARFILTENNEQSLVTLKFKVERYNLLY